MAQKSKYKPKMTKLSPSTMDDQTNIDGQPKVEEELEPEEIEEILGANIPRTACYLHCGYIAAWFECR